MLLILIWYIDISRLGVQSTDERIYNCSTKIKIRIIFEVLTYFAFINYLNVAKRLFLLFLIIVETNYRDATGSKLLYNEYLYPLFTIIGIKIMMILMIIMIIIIINNTSATTPLM